MSDKLTVKSETWKLPEALAPLTALPHWVVWRWVKKKNGKFTKPPFQLNGKKAESDEPHTWTTFDAVNGANGFDGIGFVLTNTEFAAFDIDDCRDPDTGTVHPWAQALVDKANTYTEITPSGTGLRLIGLGIGPAVHRKLKVMDGVTVEPYRRATRFITVSGNVYRDLPLANIDAALDAVLAELDGQKNPVDRVFGQPPNGNAALSPALLTMLRAPEAGGYPSRSELLFAFLTGAIKAKVPDDTITAACLDPSYRGGIFAHVDENGGAAYVKQQIAKARKTTRSRGLPKILVVSGQIARAIDETEQALLTARQPVLVRAGVLVQPLWSRYPTAAGAETQITTLKPLTVPNLAYMINRHAAEYYRWDGRKKAETIINPPHDVLAALLDLGHWGFPRVTGVISTPTLRPDGGILTEAGHDAATGLWHWPDKKLKLPPIADKPSKKEAEAALELLNALLAEMPFVADLDRAVALAAMITVVVRGAFDVAPLFLFLAPEAGTGKSYLVDVIAHIATGRWCPVISVRSTAEEMEKRLGALLLEAPPVISLDNLTTDLRGELLCQMTERPLVKVRVLGKSETPECEWRGTVFATGNNIRLVGDMTRRGLICNLDAEAERPEARTFKGNPIASVLADRGKYVAAALTVVRAYLAAGERVQCPSLGSYGGWSRFVREPLLWLGQADPVKSMEQARHDDPERGAAQRLVEQWQEHLGLERSYKVTDIIKIASETRSGVDLTWERVRPEFFDLLLERAGNDRGNEIKAQRLGVWLRGLRGQVHSRHRIVVAHESQALGNQWKLEAVQPKGETRV